MDLGPTLQIGATAYTVLGFLGRGGMAEVHRGYHPHLDREVAIKVLSPGSDAERFLREGRLAAKVRSDHAVSVYDYHVLADGSPVIVMELVKGDSLDDLIHSRGPLSEDDLVRYMRHAAMGMAAVAEAGIIHRDLKPSNLLIDTSRRLRIADFGIARLHSQAAGADVQRLTQSGMVFGTPVYMAPEQAEDPHGADVRSDVYSYGATFYHAATGVPPFEAPGILALLLKHKLETPASPKSRRPDLSSRLNDVIERCLAKAPSERFQSFEHLRSTLDDPAIAPWQESFDPVVQHFTSRYAEARARLQQSASDTESAERFTLPNGRSISITRGDIAHARADAIVSSDDETLSMGGGVSAALNRESGYTLADQAKAYGRIRHGGVVVTGAGKLRARYVLHAVTVDYQTEGTFLPSRDILLQILAGCLYHADVLRLKSLAFPLLGTGAAQFPPVTCLDTMMGYLIRALLFGAHSVDHVEIVLHRGLPPDRW